MEGGLCGTGVGRKGGAAEQVSAGGHPRPRAFQLHTSLLPATVGVQVGPNGVKGHGKTVIRLCRAEVVTV